VNERSLPHTRQSSVCALERAPVLKETHFSIAFVGHLVVPCNPAVRAVHCMKAERIEWAFDDPSRLLYPSGGFTLQIDSALLTQHSPARLLHLIENERRSTHARAKRCESHPVGVSYKTCLKAAKYLGSCLIQPGSLR